MAKKKIWCLFSIANEYDQPDYNLVAWWGKKPSFMSLANALGVDVDLNCGSREVGKILNGGECRIRNADYRLDISEESEMFEKIRQSEVDGGYKEPWHSDDVGGRGGGGPFGANF